VKRDTAGDTGRLPETQDLVLLHMGKHAYERVPRLVVVQISKMNGCSEAQKSRSIPPTPAGPSRLSVACTVSQPGSVATYLQGHTRSVLSDFNTPWNTENSHELIPTYPACFRAMTLMNRVRSAVIWKHDLAPGGDVVFHIEVLNGPYH